MDCYKKVIDIFLDNSTVWTGYDAKYFDECDRSGTATVEAKTWAYRESTQDIVKSGTVNPTSIGFCKNLPLIGTTREGNPTT